MSPKGPTESGDEGTDESDSREGLLAFGEDTTVMVLFVVLGFLCLTGAVLVGLTDLTNTYRHHLTEDAGFSSGDGTESYEDLSPAARDVFQTALESQGTVWTASPVSGLSYPSSEGAQVTAVEYQESTYELSTQRQIRSVAITARGLRISLGVVGGLLLLTGGWLLSSTRILDRSVTRRERRVAGCWVPAWAFVLTVPPVVAVSFSLVSQADVLTDSLGLFLVSAAIVGITVSAVPTAYFFRTVGVDARVFFHSAIYASFGWVFALLSDLSPGVLDIVTTALLLTFVVLYTVLGEIIGWNVWRRLMTSPE